MANESKHMLHSLGGSTSFGNLSLKAKVLWPMLISECDDQGRFNAKAQSVKWTICQNVDEIAREDIDALLSEMVNEGMLIRYGNDYAQVVNWWPHQPMAYARPSKFPPPEEWTDRIRYRQGSSGWIKRNWDSPGGFVNGIPIHYLNDTGNHSDKRKEGKVKEGKVKPSKEDKGKALVKHWAVQCYQHVVHKHVKIPLREEWVAFAERNYAGEEDARFDALKADIKAFMAKGWYEGNIAWFMEWVESGKPEKWKGKSGKRGEQSEGLTPEQVAEYFPDS